MPAAAVIPAPIAYTNIAVVKKLVVGSRTSSLATPVREDVLVLCAA